MQTRNVVGLLLAGGILMVGGAMPPDLKAQPTTSSAQPLRVFIDCQVDGCDQDYFRTEIPIVDYVRDRADASVHVLVTTQATGGGGLEYTVNFIGLRELAGTGDTLRYVALEATTTDQKRQALARTIKVGLVRYVARTPARRDRLQITFTPAVPESSTKVTAADPWNLWVFRLSANGNFSGEQSQHFTTLRSSTQASRTSERWKSRIIANGSYSESKFTFSDGSKFANYSHSYGANQLLVKSLGPHWSAGERAALSSSTFLNQKLTLRLAPAVEYNIFPYSESTRRQLTFQYAVGVNAYRYEDTTIFEKLSEVRPDQTMTVSLDLKQPWGSVSASLEGAAYLDDFSKRRAVLFNFLDVRLFKGFSVNMFISTSFVRDQLYLAKGELSDEDILVRRRQLASSFNYFGGIGLSYTFGSIFNNVVNPRFEGSSGGNFFF
jgi:hypothetical protein